MPISAPDDELQELFEHCLVYTGKTFMLMLHTLVGIYYTHQGWKMYSRVGSSWEANHVFLLLSMTIRVCDI